MEKNEEIEVEKKSGNRKGEELESRGKEESGNRSGRKSGSVLD